jgi:hypothetical protein
VKKSSQKTTHQTDIEVHSASAVKKTPFDRIIERNYDQIERRAKRWGVSAKVASHISAFIRGGILFMSMVFIHQIIMRVW